MSFISRPAGLTSLTATAVGLAAFLLALTGCQSAVNNPGNVSSAAPVRGGSASIVLTADVQPGVVFAPRAGNTPWLPDVLQPLTRTDPTTREPSPVLATAWDVSPDGLSVGLTLRSGVTFHTGRPFTADDVKFTFTKAAEPAQAAQFGFVAQQIASIDIADDTHLTLRLKTPLPNIFDFFEGTPIIDSQTFAGLADGSQVVGTGPYTFSDWKVGSSLTLKRYDGYWDRDAAYLDSIQFDVITDATAQVSALRSNRAVVAAVGPTDAASFRGQPSYSIESAGGNIITFGMNVDLPPFDKKDVRQAVGYAIDRDRINAQVLAGLGAPSNVFWPPAEPGYDAAQASTYTYDPDKARQMIADAGATGAEVPVVLAAIPLWQGVYEIVQNNLEAVGLKPVARVLNTTEFDQQQTAGDMGPAFINIHGQVGLSSVSLLSSTPALRPTNPSKFYPKRYEELRTAYQAAKPGDEATKALHDLTTYMLDEAFTQPILQAPSPVVVSSRIQGLRFSVRGGYLLDKAYLTQ